jgi:hypothetical protein
VPTLESRDRNQGYVDVNTIYTGIYNNRKCLLVKIDPMRDELTPLYKNKDSYLVGRQRLPSTKFNHIESLPIKTRQDIFRIDDDIKMFNEKLSTTSAVVNVSDMVNDLAKDIFV